MTGDTESFKFDDKGIRNVLKAMESTHAVRVGIFGGTHPKGRQAAATSKVTHKRYSVAGSDTGTTNAEVGFVNEFGRPKTEHSPAIPARSWLMMPLRVKHEDIVKDAAFPFEQTAKDGDAVKFYTKLGIACVAQIRRAFQSGGFGAWQANAPSTIKAKGSASPLYDTGQLNRSVTWVVV